MKNKENTFVRLEYNEKQGGFHFDNYTHEKNTFGWITICDSISDKQASEFAELMREKYPGTDWSDFEARHKYEYPILQIIQKEFRNFLLT